jgi:hypothetical protein
MENADNLLDFVLIAATKQDAKHTSTYESNDCYD